MFIPVMLGALGGIVLASLPKWRDWQLTKAIPIETNPTSIVTFKSKPYAGRFVPIALANKVTGATRPVYVQLIQPEGAGWLSRFVYGASLPSNAKAEYAQREAWMPQENETAVVELQHLFDADMVNEVLNG